MKVVVGENGRNPEKNLPRPRFVHQETHMEGPRLFYYLIYLLLAIPVVLYGCQN